MRLGGTGRGREARRVELRVAFLNCCNLFAVGARPDRFAGTAADLDSKITCLADTLRELLPGAPPHLVGLAEVGARDLGERVGDAMEREGYAAIWSGEPPGGREGPETGLMVLYDHAALAPVPGGATTWPQVRGARAKWLATALQLQAGTEGTLWFVVNHWKSQMGGETKTEPARMDCARQLGEFYLEEAREHTDAMVLVGDFNCEPGDRPLREQRMGRDAPNRLRAVRERPLILRDRNRLAYFYNPMWRWLPEPDLWEDSAHPGYQRPRPLGTHLGNPSAETEWRMWDQIMVTKPCLTGPFVRLREASVVVAPSREGCSDHWAVGAILDC